MKLALRDDDLNWFFEPDVIESNLDGIWDICPVSMSAVPKVLGDWKRNVTILEGLGPNNITQDVIDDICSDQKEYRISENKLLVDYVKTKINENKIHLTIHGIYHRNRNETLPVLKNNFAIGAEFITDKDLSKELEISKVYLEKTFGQRVTVFTAPQNMINTKGIKAVQNCGLNICVDLPSVKKPIAYLSSFTLRTYVQVCLHKIFGNKKMPFPNALEMSKGKIIDHCRLQPSSNVELIKDKIKYIHERHGNIVISTHSYGFDQKMNHSDLTMKEALLEILNFASSLPDVDFVSIDKVFE